MVRNILFSPNFFGQVHNKKGQVLVGAWDALSDRRGPFHWISERSS